MFYQCVVAPFVKAKTKKSVGQGRSDRQQYSRLQNVTVYSPVSDWFPVRSDSNCYCCRSAAKRKEDREKARPRHSSKETTFPWSASRHERASRLPWSVDYQVLDHGWFCTFTYVQPQS